MTTNQLLLSRAEAARALSICEQTVIDLERRGVLVPIRIGRSVRYRMCDVEKVAGVAGAGKKEQPVTAAD